jgi:poly(ADP-ribose) glycohydrolase ARH3
MRGRPLDRRGFFTELLERAKTDEFQWVLRTASRLGPENSPHMLGNTLEAHRSVGSAIACFTQEPESYTEVIARAINLGGDTDTIAAMAGAMSGAHLGVSAIPRQLIERLEDGPKGRAYIESLAVRLWEARCMMMP